jgi:regulator of sigma E protease
VDNAGIWTSIDYALELSFLKEDKSVAVQVVRPGTAGKMEFLLDPVKKSTYRLGVTTQIDPATKQWKIITVDADSNGGSPTLKPGDVLVSINGVDTTDQTKASAQVSGSGGKTLPLVVLRDGKETSIETTPGLKTFYSDRGVVFAEKTGFTAAIGESVRYSASIVKLTFKGLSKIFTGEIAPKDGLSGPVGVVDMVGSVVNQNAPIRDKLSDLLWLFALISLNLGVFNLLPIPALDGSHLLLIAVEAIRRKRLSPKVENKIVLAGFFLIIGLAVMGLIFDIMRIAGRS